MLEDYIKASDLLTINSDNIVLNKQIHHLEEKNKENEYIIKGKLQEKDEEIKGLKEQFTKMESMISNLVTNLGKMKQQDEINVMASSLYSSGILRKG